MNVKSSQGIAARGMAKGYAAGRAHIKSLVKKERLATAQPQASAQPSGKSIPPPPRAPRPGEPGHIDSSKVYPATTMFDNLDILPGCVRRDVGVVFHFGGSEYVVTSIGQSNAKCECLVRKSKRIEDKTTGEVREFLGTGEKITVSNQIHQDEVIRRMTPEELNNLLSNKGRGNKQQNNQENKSMKKTATKSNNGMAKMSMITSMAKASKSEKEITAAVKADFGPNSEHTTYIIGREWRRNNKAAKPAKGVKTPPAPAKKATAQAPAKRAAKTPPPAPAKKATAPVPPPAPKVEAPAEAATE